MAEVRRGSLQQGEWGLADVYGGWRVTQQKAWRTIKRQDAHHEDHHATKYRGFRNQSRCRRSDTRSDQDSHSEALLCTIYNHTNSKGDNGKIKMANSMPYLCTFLCWKTHCNWDQRPGLHILRLQKRGRKFPAVESAELELPCVCVCVCVSSLHC